MTKRVSIIGSPAGASVVPGWNDYEFAQFERIFLTEGVISGFAVSERGAGANMSVDVALGKALIEITNTNVAHGKTYKVYFDSDATENISITTADGTHPRIDRICLRVDVVTDPNGNASNIAIIEAIAGTPAGSPSAPSEPSNAITLALVSVPASDTTISTGQITDSRTYADIASTILANIARADTLAGTGANQGASTVGVRDVAGNFTGTNVEAVLAELVEMGGSNSISLIPETGNPATIHACAATANYLGSSTIAFDAITKSFASANTSFTISHTCTGSNRYLLVCINTDNVEDTNIVTSVTYAGVSMTKIGAYADSGSLLTLTIWALIAPATGANNVVITQSSSKAIVYSFVSYTGCNQTAQPTTSDNIKVTATTTLPLLTTKVAGNDWVFGWGRAGSGNFAAGANTTLRGTASGEQVGDTNGTDTYTVTMTAGSSTHRGVVTAIRPAAPTPFVRVFDFDQSLFEAAEWQFTLPDNYAGGTITAKVHWTTTAASGDVVWGVQAGCVADNEAISGTGLGTAQEVTDGATGAAKLNVTAATSAITIAGTPTAGKLVSVRVYRNAAHASDTLAADARLVAVELSLS